RDELACHFHDINLEWIETMFKPEARDREALEHPREHIIEPGGTILFAEAAGLGIVGTCALQKHDDGSYELTKMAVLERARGLKVGEYLLGTMLERARALHAAPLFLLSNTDCAAAVHLYEKHGFQHDTDIMAR